MRYEDFSLIFVHYVKFIATLDPFFGIKNYIKIKEVNPHKMEAVHYSIIEYFPLIVGEYIHYKYTTRQPYIPPSTLSGEQSPLNPNKKLPKPNKHLYIILVESFESWAIGDGKIESKDITPNVNLFLQNNHILYFPNVKSQALGGVSSDGQMTTLTGLLPIQHGSASMKYGRNIYPGIPKLYKESTLVDPFPTGWNRSTMSIQYGIKRLIDPKGGKWNDYQIIQHFTQSIDSSDFSVALTISSHMPFKVGEDGPLRFAEDMPKVLHDYINAIHYMDGSLAQFFERFDKDTMLQNSVIVITGDHTIFKKSMTPEFRPYAERHNQPIPRVEGFIPLIIYSPDIKERRIIEDTVYQMDIYPTILSLIGCEEYSWRGVGVNLLNDSLMHHRTISEKEAYELCNGLIEHNYFKHYKDCI